MVTHQTPEVLKSSFLVFSFFLRALNFHVR
jgi:hypothetical protein